MRKLFILLLIPFVISACGIASNSEVEEQQGASDIALPPLEEGSSIPLEEEISESHLPEEMVSSPSSANDLEPGGDPALIPLRENVRVPDLTEYEFSQMIPLDGIRPVYEPKFVTAVEVQDLLREDELVMGIAWGGEAKAYPVSVLVFREMVNDELAGIPALVTW